MAFYRLFFALPGQRRVERGKLLVVRRAIELDRSCAYELVGFRVGAGICLTRRAYGGLKGQPKGPPPRAFGHRDCGAGGGGTPGTRLWKTNLDLGPGLHSSRAIRKMGNGNIFIF